MRTIEIEIISALSGYQITMGDSNTYHDIATNPKELIEKVSSYLKWITEDERHYDPENYNLPRYGENKTDD